MKQSSIRPLEKGLMPSPFALQVKILIHLVTVGLPSLYPDGIFTVWKAEFARVTPSTLVLAAPEHQTGLTAECWYQLGRYLPTILRDP